MGFAIGYATGMITLTVLMLVIKRPTEESDGYTKALEGQVKKLNKKGKEILADLNEANDVSTGVLLAYRIASEENDYKLEQIIKLEKHIAEQDLLLSPEVTEEI